MPGGRHEGNGELSVSGIDVLGNTRWGSTGSDVFSGGFEIEGNRIHAVDFNDVDPP
jgi:hypothetical protein